MLFAGDLTGAASLVGEFQVAMDATGSNLAPYAELGVAALRGRQAEAAALIDATIREVNLRGEGIGIAVAEWLSAVLNNGLGNYEKAMQAAQRATAYLVELVVPRLGGGRAHRGGSAQRTQRVAADALRRLAESDQQPAAPTGRSASKLVHVRC